MSIDTSLKIEIKEKISLLLDRYHLIPEKKRVREFLQRLNFACPYCGDSAQDNRKKRGNLYWESLSFHCFNCNKHRDLDAFLRDFDLGFEGEKRIHIVTYIRSNTKYEVPPTLEFYLFKEIADLAIPKEEFFSKMKVYSVNEKSKRIYSYLKSRLLVGNLDKFGFDPKRNVLYIFNLDATGEKVVGYQTKNLKESASKYLSCNLRKMRGKLGYTDNFTEEKWYSYNKISLIFGILRTDFSRQFTIFEGPLDSFFMQNSLALTGVHKSTLNFDDLDAVRYFMDNDRDGKIMMIDKIKKGKKVFMWRKFIEDHRLSQYRIKDLNDLVKVSYREEKDILKDVNLYFTDNPKDMIYV